MRRCPKCDKIKSSSDFYKNKNASGGLRWDCKACAKAWKEKNKEKVRKAEYKRRYGITLSQYEGLYAAQNGVCAICGEPETQKIKGPLALVVIAYVANMCSFKSCCRYCKMLSTRTTREAAELQADAGV